MKKRKRSYEIPWWIEGETEWLKLVIAVVFTLLIEWFIPSTMAEHGRTGNVAWDLLVAIVAFSRCGLEVYAFFKLIEGLAYFGERRWLRWQWRKRVGHQFDPSELENHLRVAAEAISMGEGSSEAVGHFWFLHDAARRLGFMPRHNRFSDYAPLQAR